MSTQQPDRRMGHLRRRAMFRGIAVGCLAAVLVGGSVSPSSAASKATKKKKVVVKRTTTTSTTVPTTVATVAPTVAPTTLPVVIAPTVATLPPTTVSVSEANRIAFEQMFRSRDPWVLEGSVELSAEAERYRRELNRNGVEVWHGADARAFLLGGRVTAVAVALIANPAIVRPDTLQSEVVLAGRSLRSARPLKVDGGSGVVGTTSNGLGAGTVAFDKYIIDVIAQDAQQAQDALYLLTTNMGRNLTL
jgi:hypothetical protein